MRYAGAILFAVLGLSGCGPSTPPPPEMHPPGLMSALGKGWVEAPLPDSKLGPGAIVQMTPVDEKTVDLRWLGSLQESCGLPENVISIKSGDVPGVVTGKDYSIGAKVAASIAKIGVGVGAEAKGARSATLTIGAASADAFDLIRFRGWLAVPANAASLTASCGSTLSEPNIYVIQEAFVISDGSFSFRNEAGAKIAVDLPPNVPVQVGTDASGKTTGDLLIKKPIVFAFHRIQQVKDGKFSTLGGSRSASEADEASSVLAGKTIRNITGM